MRHGGAAFISHGRRPAGMRAGGARSLRRLRLGIFGLVAPAAQFSASGGVYPGETAEDVLCTARFLAEHRPYIDRVVVNRLAIVGHTPLGRAIRRNPDRYPQIGALVQNLETGLMDHENETFRSAGHLSAAMRMLREVHRINRKPLKGASLTFEGVM